MEDHWAQKLLYRFQTMILEWCCSKSHWLPAIDNSPFISTSIFIFFYFFSVSPMCMVEKRKDRNLSDYHSEILGDNGIVYILGCNVIKIKYGSRWGQSSKGNVGILQPEPWSKHWIRKRDKRSSRTLLWKLNIIEIKYMVW